MMSFAVFAKTNDLWHWQHSRGQTFGYGWRHVVLLRRRDANGKSRCFVPAALSTRKKCIQYNHPSKAVTPPEAKISALTVAHSCRE